MKIADILQTTIQSTSQKYVVRGCVEGAFGKCVLNTHCSLQDHKFPSQPRYLNIVSMLSLSLSGLVPSAFDLWKIRSKVFVCRDSGKKKEEKHMIAKKAL